MRKVMDSSRFSRSTISCFFPFGRKLINRSRSISEGGKPHLLHAILKITSRCGVSGISPPFVSIPSKRGISLRPGRSEGFAVVCSKSQSPRSGAFRCDDPPRKTSLVARGKPSQSPRSGAFRCDDSGRTPQGRPARVSIPSKRGISLRLEHLCSFPSTLMRCLNPLEAGHFVAMSGCTQHPSQHAVSIPSKRGISLR